jgi:hypothetical protein
MFYPVLTIGAMLVMAVLLMIGPTATEMRRRYRGLKVLRCPGTGAPAGVVIDAHHAVCTAALRGEPALRVRLCSNWPARAACHQECLRAPANRAELLTTPPW